MLQGLVQVLLQGLVLSLSQVLVWACSRPGPGLAAGLVLGLLLGLVQDLLWGAGWTATWSSGISCDVPDQDVFRNMLEQILIHLEISHYKFWAVV